MQGMESRHVGAGSRWKDEMAVVETPAIRPIWDKGLGRTFSQSHPALRLSTDTVAFSTSPSYLHPRSTQLRLQCVR